MLIPVYLSVWQMIKRLSVIKEKQIAPKCPFNVVNIFKTQVRISIYLPVSAKCMMQYDPSQSITLVIICKTSSEMYDLVQFYFILILSVDSNGCNTTLEYEALELKWLKLKTLLVLSNKPSFVWSWARGEKSHYECHMPLRESPCHLCNPIVTVVNYSQ